MQIAEGAFRAIEPRNYTIEEVREREGEIVIVLVSVCVCVCVCECV